MAASILSLLSPYEVFCFNVFETVEVPVTVGRVPFGGDSGRCPVVSAGFSGAEDLGRDVVDEVPPSFDRGDD
jgi:hypothetical protein